MKKHVYALLFSTYAAALIGYGVYQLHQYRRSFEPLVPYSHPMQQPETTETAAQTTTTALSTTAVTTVHSTAEVTTTTTAVTSTAAVTSAVTTTVTTTTQTAAETTSTSTTTSVTETTAVVFPIDLNTATLEQLCALPEIGEVTAQAILDYRESHGGFVSRSELLEIEGIGEIRYEAIFELLYITNEQELPEEPAPGQTVTEPVTEPPTEAETEILMIDLNTATIDDLMQLPGCGETEAQAILDLREEIDGFHNPDEILMAEEISDAMYLAWEPYLAVDGEGHTQLPVDRNP